LEDFVRLVIDTDPGMGTVGTDPEDGLAILYALNSPGVAVEGITLVQGNVPLSHSWPNARHLLELAGRIEVPVHAGAVEPRDPKRRALQTAWLNQRAGMGSAVPEREVPDDTAAEFLCETVLGAPGEITLVAIGPLTNVAAAIEAAPEVAGALADLVIMGGTVEVPGNITPAAEFNIWMDPEAAEIVFDSGAPISMIGLDVCHRTHFSTAQVERLKESASPLGEFVAQSAATWIDVRERTLGADDGPMHLYDTLAMASAIDDDVVECRSSLVRVETSMGPAEGMTVTYLNEALRQLLTGRDHNARVAVEVDTARFEALFAERVLAHL
jgi:purine nucleosidase